MVYIKKVETRGFKSLGSRPVHVNFDGKFIGITGPNGSGKSNIIDAILFALGQNSPKLMRVNRLRDLIFDGAGNNPSSDARVTLTLDNSDRTIPVDNDRVTITREIKSSGDSKYLINGKKTQKGNLTELLRLSLINPDGLNFVPQGMVTHLADRSSEEKRRIIEEIVGVAQFDEKKTDALKQLDFADRKLEVSMAKIGEVKKNINSLEEERNDELRLRFLETERQWLNSVVISKKIYDIELSIINNNKKLETISNEKKELENEISILKNKFKAVEIEKKDFLEKAIGNQGDELIKVELNLSHKKTELETLQKKIIDYEQTTNKIKDSLPHLRQMHLDNQKASKESILKIKNLSIEIKKQEIKLKNFKTEIHVINNKYNNTQTLISDEEDQLMVYNNELTELQSKETQLNIKLANNTTRKSVLEEKIEGLAKRVKAQQDMVKTLQQHISEFESLHQQEKNSISSITFSNSALINKQEIFEVELNKAIEILQKANEAIIKHESKVETAKEMTLTQNTPSKLQVLSHDLSISGYLGQIEEVIKFDGSYQIALRAASKRWSNAVVVDEMSSLLEVVQIIKKYKLGRIALIPLSDVNDSARVQSPQNDDVIGSLADFVVTDKKYQGLVNFILGDTLLVKTAKLAYIWSQKGFRTVTISGDLFEPGGSVFETGNVSPLANLFFDSKSLSQIKYNVDSLRQTIKKRKLDIKELNSQSKKIEINHNDRKLSLEKLTLEISNLDEMRIRYTNISKNLNQQISQHNKDVQNYSTELKNQDINVKNIQQKIITVKNKTNNNGSVNSLKKNLKKLEENKNQLQLKIEHSSDSLMELETSLSREQANLEHNIKLSQLELEKKISDYEKEHHDKTLYIKDSNSKMPELKSQVNDLSDNVEKLKSKSQKMKYVIDNYDKSIRTLNHDQESKIKTLYKIDSHGISLENNNSRLMDSKISSMNKLSSLGYNSPLKYFPGIDSIISYLDLEYNQLKTNVNLRADKNYRQIYSGYKSYSQRINQLDIERNSILEFIKNIDSKKRGTFLEAFKKIDKELRYIFSKLTTRENGIHGEAWLELDDPDDIFNSGVSLMAQFPNKIARESAIISGGEKTVSALCLILAIQAVTPAPFYLFDEIDAHLDAVNSSALAEILRERTDRSQIIMISLKDSILSRVDSMYGVYHEKGISKVLRYQPNIPIRKHRHNSTP